MYSRNILCPIKTVTCRERKYARLVVRRRQWRSPAVGHAPNGAGSAFAGAAVSPSRQQGGGGSLVASGRGVGGCGRRSPVVGSGVRTDGHRGARNGSAGASAPAQRRGSRNSTEGNAEMSYYEVEERNRCLLIKGTIPAAHLSHLLAGLPPGSVVKSYGYSDLGVSLIAGPSDQVNKLREEHSTSQAPGDVPSAPAGRA